jgi:hypothetical protein
MHTCIVNFDKLVMINAYPSFSIYNLCEAEEIAGLVTAVYSDGREAGSVGIHGRLAGISIDGVHLQNTGNSPGRRACDAAQQEPFLVSRSAVVDDLSGGLLGSSVEHFCGFGIS